MRHFIITVLIILALAGVVAAAIMLLSNTGSFGLEETDCQPFHSSSVLLHDPPGTTAKHGRSRFSLVNDNSLIAYGRAINTIVTDLTGNVVWTYVPSPANECLCFATPLADGGWLAGTDNVELHAYDSSGFELWKFSGDKSNREEHMASRAVVAPDGTVYFLAFKDGLYAVRPRPRDPGSIAPVPTAELLWHLPVDGASGQAPLIGPEGNIYITELSGGLYAVSPAGDVLWHDPLGPYPSEMLVVTDSGIVMAMSHHQNYIKAFSPDGGLMWRIREPVSQWTRPIAMPDGGVVVHNGDFSAPEVYSVDTQGTVRWRVALKKPARHLAPDADGNIWLINRLRDGYQPDAVENAIKALGGQSEAEVVVISPGGDVIARHVTNYELYPIVPPLHLPDGRTMCIGIRNAYFYRLSGEGR